MHITYTSILNQWDPRHGGGQRSVHDLAVAMTQRGHDVRVVYSSSAKLPANLPYRPVVVPHHDRLYLNPLEFARVFFRSDAPCDIFHTQGYEGAFLRAVLRKSVPLVATPRHPDPPTLKQKPGALRPRARLAWYRRLVIPLLERRALRAARIVVCVSQYSSKTLVERGYLSPDASTAVVYNGAGPLESAGETPPNVEFVCAARLDRHKGIDVLLRALPLLGGYPPHVDLLGTGPEEASLRALARELGLGQRVRFHGLVTGSQVGAFLRKATALVVPSLSENFPRVVLEGLRAGVPIVATAVGGIPEAVENDKQALLIPPGDPAALAVALRRVRDDLTLRQRLGAAALARAAEFTWERSAEQLEVLYTSLIEEPADA